MALVDEELVRVRRAFDTAFARMCRAGVPEVEDELSNLLHHHYRLGELVRRRWTGTKQQLDAEMRQRAPGALGALWIRGYDTHEIAAVSVLGDRFTDFFTDLFGTLEWLPLTAMPFVVQDRDGRWQDYVDHLQEKPVVDSLHAAFNKLAELA